MSRPTDPHVYPVQFLQYVEEFSQDPKLQVTIPFDSVSEARSFRLAFYSFRTGAMKEEMHKSPLYSAIPMLMVQVFDSPPRAVISHKDHGDLSARMEAAMKKAKEPKAPKPVELSPAARDILNVWIKNHIDDEDSKLLRDTLYRDHFYRTMSRNAFEAAFEEAKRMME